MPFRIFVSPELALTDRWMRVWRSLGTRICVVGFDEAHCIVQWYVNKLLKMCSAILACLKTKRKVVTT